MHFSKLFLVASFLLVSTYAQADEVLKIQAEASQTKNEISFNKASDNTKPTETNASETEKQKPKETTTETQAVDKKTQEPVSEIPEESFSFDQGYGLEEGQTMGAYNYPARIKVKDAWDIYLKGSYIYWQAKEKGMDIGLIVPANTATGDYQIAKMSFNYQSGFKVAMGTVFDHDNWIGEIEYARLHTKHHTQPKAPIGGYIQPLWINNSTISNQALKIQANWYLNYDMLHLEFARPFYEGTKLTIKPFMGLLGGWIDQRTLSIASIYTNTFTIYSKAYTNSWLIGPRMGFNTHWLLGYNFDIEANIAASLAYQKIKTGFKQQHQYFSTQLAYRVREKLGQITPEIEATLGLGCGTYFDDHKWNFSIQALYDFIYYFDQNHMRKITDLILRNVETKPNDLILHGLTVTLRLDF